MFSYMRGACNIAKFTVYGVHMEKRYIETSTVISLKTILFHLRKHQYTSISVSMQEKNQQT